MNRYIKQFTTYCLTLIVFISGFNWFIDPYGMYWSTSIAGINQNKPLAHTRTRITKIYQYNKLHPNTVVIGNSRIEIGINPDSSYFSGDRVYNLGLTGAKLEMQIDYAIQAILGNPNLENVYLSVDFLDFLVPIEKHESYLQFIQEYGYRLKHLESEIPNSSMKRLKEKLGLVVSLDSLKSAMHTVLMQGSTTNLINSRGFNNANSYVEIMNTEGIKPLFIQKLNEVSSRLAQPLKLDNPTDHQLSKLDKVRSMLDVSREHDVNVTIFINPYHYSYLHILNESNQWRNFFSWKRALVELTDTYDIELWDFSGFNAIVCEKVPLESPNENMDWFWEPAHYKSELGELMLANMLTPSPSKTFGVKLTPANLEEQLNKDISQLHKTLKNWNSLKVQLKIKL